MSEWIPISGEEWDGNEDGRWFVIDNGRVVAIVPDGIGLVLILTIPSGLVYVEGLLQINRRLSVKSFQSS